MRVDIVLPECAVPGQHGVYVAFDRVGEVLYIGRTKNLLQRIKGHRNSSAWFKEMRSIEFTPCDGATEARHLEKSMIGTFRPAANTLDYQPQQTSTRQRLPEWTAAKLSEMYERCVGQRGSGECNDALNNYVLALRNAGWTLAAIGEGLGLTREAVRLRAGAARNADRSPGVPAVPVKVKPAKKVKPSIPPMTLGLLLELKAEAMQVRGWTPEDSPLRAASLRYSEMLAEQVLAGVSISQIARQVGVTHLAIRARLARHGYMNDVPGLPQVGYGERQWKRHLAWGDGHCKRGHDITDPANIRHVNGDPKRPVCLPCEKVRVAAYRERQAEQKAAAA